MRSAACRRRAAANCCANCSSATAGALTDYDYVSSPLGRARETMELMRAAIGLDPAGYRTDARLMEMSFGRWEGFTFAELQAREASALAERERDKWGFVLPGGESYALLAGAGRRLVREPRARQRGVGAWRRVPRADRASSTWSSRRGRLRWRRDRAGLRLRVRRQQHGAPRIAPDAVAKSKAAGLSSSRCSEMLEGNSRNNQVSRDCSRLRLLTSPSSLPSSSSFFFFMCHGRDPLMSVAVGRWSAERRGFGPWARPLP